MSTEMERLVEAYLAFARGEGAEQVRPVDLSRMLEEVAAGARRAGADVDLEMPYALMLPLRPDAVRRAITNLVDNAQRHARQISLSAARLSARSVQVTVDDDGPGIPPEEREGMFRPFQSGSGGRHRPRTRHRARHRPRPWRRDPARGEPARRLAGAHPPPGLSPARGRRLSADRAGAAAARRGAAPGRRARGGSRGRRGRGRRAFRGRRRRAARWRGAGAPRRAWAGGA